MLDIPAPPPLASTTPVAPPTTDADGAGGPAPRPAPQAVGPETVKREHAPGARPTTAREPGTGAPAHAGVGGAGGTTGPHSAAQGSAAGGALGGPVRSDAPGAGAASGKGALALAIPGAGGGDAAAAARYRPYYDGIRRLIGQTLRYPLAARRRGLSGTVELEVEVRPTGAVGAVAVVRSSSHRVLDDAALEAARGLPPMPFPPGLPPRTLRVRIPVDFELR